MKILLVEDDDRLRSYTQDGLEHHGIVVDTAADGITGYDLASNEKYDVIILDRLLPLMHGESVCQKLRLEGNHTPILLLTALDTTQDIVSGLNAGADDYLAKPFAFEELLARLYALQRRTPQVQDQVLTIGSLIIDISNQNVIRSGQLIPLSKREFTLLEFLARHTNQTFSKEQLVEHVWEFDSNILTNTVQVYIGYLRQKIDRAFPNETPLICTVRGFGYQLRNSGATAKK